MTTKREALIRAMMDSPAGPPTEDVLADAARLNAPLGVAPSMVANEDQESLLEVSPAGQPGGGS